MKNKKAIIILSILLGALLTCVAVVSVSASSKDDPLITLSYLEEIVLPAFKEEIISEVSDISSSTESDSETNNETEQESISVEASGTVETEPENADDAREDLLQMSNTYTLLELDMGQTVMADSICEFIVRPGSKVEAVSSFPAQGIADITNGIEVLNGDLISINAYCLIPRGADGRGMKVLSEKAYIMIRGDYTIG